MANLVAKEAGTTLLDIVDRVLDKGLVINADISISVAGMELLGIKIRAALASFETAARYGLEFPGVRSFEGETWKQARAVKEGCPGCGKIVETGELLEIGCPWCGWKSFKAKERAKMIVIPSPVSGN